MCLEGTRVDLLRQIDEWADSAEGKCIFWLQGMAGTGKSTISRTVAHKLKHNRLGARLGASFFFKRGERDRGSAARFFTTIAAQLVCQLPSMAEQVRNAIDADFIITENSIKDQFKMLLLDPLKKVAEDMPKPKTMVVVVDALDECDSEDDIKSIISLLPEIKSLASIRLRFFVTSRPDRSILNKFGTMSDTYQDLVLHRVDEYIIKHDISTFLKSQLRHIWEDYNASLPGDEKLSETWPSQTNIQQLVDKAGRLFIVAASYCRFIGDRDLGTPTEQLVKVLEHQTREHEDELDITYLLILDQLLVTHVKGEVVRRTGKAREDILEGFRQIVGSIVILADPLPTANLAQLLKIPQTTIDNKLTKLHSVLDIRPDHNAPVKLLHLSFRDFLVDPDIRAKEFWVDEKEIHAKLWTRCLDLLEIPLKENICGQKPETVRKDIDKQMIDRQLPSEVQYACCYWVYHLKGSGIKVKDEDEAHRFLKLHFLHWLEALSLIGRMSETLGLIDELRRMVDVSHLQYYLTALTKCYLVR
jgi:hypothetical protein